MIVLNVHVGKAKILLMDIYSLAYHIETADIYADMALRQV